MESLEKYISGVSWSKAMIWSWGMQTNFDHLGVPWHAPKQKYIGVLLCFIPIEMQLPRLGIETLSLVMQYLSHPATTAGKVSQTVYQLPREDCQSVYIEEKC